MNKNSVAIYVRVSTEAQAQKESSIPEQIDRCKGYCRARSWSVFHVYTDAGFSGGSINRPAIQQLIADAKEKKFDRVLVYKLDRLSRSQKDTLYLIEDVFIKNDVSFVSLSESFDTGTPFGIAMVGILSVFAQLERANITERMSLGRTARAKKGKYHGGSRAPIGYRYIDGELVVDPYEASLIRKIFDMCESGMSPHRIAVELNDNNLTRGDLLWNQTLLKNVLTKKTYIGMVQFKGEWYPGEHEPIITPEQFDIVQKKLAEFRKTKIVENRNPGKASSLLAGLIYCKRCGAKYYKGNNGTRPGKPTIYSYNCYNRRFVDSTKIKCTNKGWRMEKLDELVLNEVAKLRIDTSALQQHQPEKEKPDLSAGFQAELKKIDSQIVRLMDLYSEDDMPLDILKGRIENLNKRREGIMKELEAIRAAEKNKPSENEIKELAENLAEYVSLNDLPASRKILAELIDRIEIDGEDIDIFWKF